MSTSAMKPLPQNYFWTEAEAEAAHAAQRAKQLAKFCPLINASCRDDCASFVENKVQPTRLLIEGEPRDVFKAPYQSAYCINALVNGAITLEQ